MRDGTWRAVRLCDREGLYALTVRDGTIAAIAPDGEAPVAAMSVGGDWVSLGGADLQINGALGVPFSVLNAALLPKLGEISAFLWRQGIDAYVPTIVTSAIASTRAAIAAIDRYRAESNADPGRAHVLGVHLEGPFLNPDKRGAHPREHLQPLSRAGVASLIGECESVRLVTLAPELDPSGEAIAWLRERGIVVSLGHSLATAEQAKAAFDRGATMVTHAFNAMPPLHHREPGLLGAALVDGRVWCGAIADGRHVSPTMLQVLLRANPETFLVSDALAPFGLGDGRYPWDERTIAVENGTARLENGTLAGTTRSLLVGAQNLAAWGCCAPETAIWLATEAPRAALGLPGLRCGEPATLLRWHWDEKTRSLSWQRLD